MKADSITQRIMDEARRDAERIIAEAHSREDSLRAAKESEAAKLREENLKRAKDDAEAEHGRMLRMADLDNRKRDLALKREVLDLAFKGALERMESMDAEQAARFNRSRLLEAACKDGRIVISQHGEAVFTPEYIASINAELNASLELDPVRRDIGGGFILSRSGMEINCTYAALLENARGSLEMDAALAIFPPA